VQNSGIKQHELEEAFKIPKELAPELIEEIS
jgi:hypothetical protein